MQTSYFKYFGYACQHKPTMVVSTSMVICMTKIHFIIHVFLAILHFKESCNLIGRQHFGKELESQDFARYGTDYEISITMLVFILDYCEKKLIPKIFKKINKILFLWPFWALFSQTWKKKNFRGEGLSVFKSSNYLQSCKKSEKTNNPYLRKLPD